MTVQSFSSRMQYDSQTNTYSNYPGIEVRVPGFRLTDTVEYLDDAKLVGYFNKFVKYFVGKGYVKNKTIRAAPYDWRLAPGKPIYNRSWVANTVKSQLSALGFSWRTIVNNALCSDYSLENLLFTKIIYYMLCNQQINTKGYV